MRNLYDGITLDRQQQGCCKGIRKNAGPMPSSKREKAMFKPLAILASVAMLSLGATAASAQVSVKVGRGGVDVKVGRGDNDRRDNGRRDNDRGVRQERVCVEDFQIVEERYLEAGHYEHRDRQVWVPEAHVTVVERVYVAERHYTVEEQ